MDTESRTKRYGLHPETDKCITGMWLIDKTSGKVSCIGKPPRPNIYKRIAIAYQIARTPGSIVPNFRLMKAVIKGLKSPHVSSSGKPIVTTGLSLEEDWTRFSRTECGLPQTLQGN